MIYCTIDKRDMGNQSTTPSNGEQNIMGKLTFHDNYKCIFFHFMNYQNFPHQQKIFILFSFLLNIKVPKYLSKNNFSIFLLKRNSLISKYCQKEQKKKEIPLTLCQYHSRFYFLNVIKNILNFIYYIVAVTKIEIKNI